MSIWLDGAALNAIDMGEKTLDVLSYEQRQEHNERCKQAFMEWLRIADKEGYFKNRNFTPTQLCAEIWHSALLKRLLDGKDVFPYPPPRAFSYPWYELLEIGEAIIFECCFYTDGILGKGKRVVIEQSNQWEIVKELSSQDYLLKYHERAPLFRLTFVESLGKWKIQKMLRWPSQEEE